MPKPPFLVKQGFEDINLLIAFMLPYVIDSHAWEIAKAKSAKSAAKEVQKAEQEHTAKKKEKPLSYVDWAQDKGFIY